MDPNALAQDQQGLRDKLDKILVHGQHLDYPAMCRLAGEIRSLDYALGLPDVLKDSDPTSQAPPTP
jgi:hypothetical protein